MNRPNASSPVLVMTAEVRPCFAAAMATLVALPPTDLLNVSTSSMYPPQTLERLRRIKAELDPGNVFRHNHNFTPAR